MDRMKKELFIEAKTEKLDQVNEFLEEELEILNCSMKACMQILLAVEEIFVNIASYAYATENGMVYISIEKMDEETHPDPMVEIHLADSGAPYNPLEREDPDITLSAEERSIGGLGIFMVKKIMDEVLYEYKDGKNDLAIRKKI